MIKYVVLILYAVMIVGVLTLTAKKSLSLNDFLLGGRSVGAWMSALSYGASYFSAVIIVGYAGSMGWQYGIAAAWAGIGNAVIGSLLAWSLLAKPVRRMGERLDVSTIPGFFEKRYNAKWMKLMAAVIIFVFLIPYSASVYKGLGTMFRMALGIDYTWGVIGIAALAALYLFAGGYKATAITDFVQGSIMIVGVVLIIAYIINGAGGLKNGLEELGKMEGGTFNSMGITKANAQGLLSNVLLTSLGVLGLPQMLHKFFAIKDEKSISKGTIISTLFAIVVAGGCYFLGGFGRLYDVDVAANGFDAIIPSMLEGLPDILIGIVVILVLSASMSTLSSLVMTSASTLTLDFISGTVVKKMSEKAKLTCIRVFIGVFIVISVVIAAIQYKSNVTFIAQLMGISWGALAGSFLAPFLYGLYMKRASKLAAWFSFGFGTAVMSLNLFFKSAFPAFLQSPINCGAFTMIVGLIAVPVISLFTKPNKEKVDATFSCYEEKVTVSVKQTLGEGK